jgi:hypothetical protein
VLRITIIAYSPKSVVYGFHHLNITIEEASALLSRGRGKYCFHAGIRKRQVRGIRTHPVKTACPRLLAPCGAQHAESRIQGHYLTWHFSAWLA